jgi:streptogramin lyase
MSLKAKNIILELFFSVTILIFTTNKLHGQTFILRSYTTKEGLPHNNVRAIVKDSTGFLWLGTWDGLSRYDGHEFKNYFHIPGDPASLPYFSVLGLYVDGANNLWIFTDRKQVVLYNPCSDDFTILKSFDDYSFEHPANICTDENGDLWIIGHSELMRRDYKSGTFEKFRITDTNGAPLLIEDVNLWISTMGKNKIWLTGNQVYELQKTDSTNEYKICSRYSLDSSFFSQRIFYDHLTWYSFFESESGNKWIFSNFGLFKLDENKRLFKGYRGEIPYNEFTGQKIYCWGWKEDGIYLYNSVNKQLSHIPSETTQLILAILPGKDNSVWFSNISPRGVPLGLNQLVFTPGLFRNRLINAAKQETPAVFSVIMDKDKNIWTGVRGIDHIIKYRKDNSISRTGYLTPELNSISGHIRSMIPVTGGIWIGYYNALLQFYDYNSGRFSRHFPSENIFRTIAVSKEGNIFIGTDKLSIYNPITGKTELLWRSPGPEVIFTFHLDGNGILWGGMTESKLLKFNTLTNEAKVYKVVSDPYNIEDILPGRNGDLWLALLGGGLCRFNPETNSSRQYTTTSGLSNNTTYSLLNDNSGNIWISTDNGISRFNPETGQFRIFSKTDGLEISEFNSRARFKTTDGEFIFGGMGGFVIFNPDSISQSEKISLIPRLIITELKVSGEVRHLPQPLNDTDTILFFKGENNFHISFSSTDFINPEKTKFRYRLSGINDAWIATDSYNRNINYANLKPGWYNLLIEASDVDGRFVSTKSLTIRISPYFYQMKIFHFSGLILILWIIISIIVIYIRHLKQRERVKQDELRLNSLRGQMNPHFIFNSLNSINYFISNNDRLSANRYIADFSRLIRNILSNLGNTYIPFENEISSINDYLRIEHLRFGDKFNFELKTIDVGYQSQLEVVPGLVQPFIENAIWHGVRPLESRKGTIMVRFLPTGSDRIKCIIEDDGVGRSVSLKKHRPQGNHKSRGIEIVIERLQIISKMRGVNYGLEINDIFPDSIETGTRVKIDLPIKLT